MNSNTNTSKIPNSIYTSSQGYFSFKIKNNLNKVKESDSIYKNENNNNNIEIKKKNDSLLDSRASSKFNFKINDDIHDSEFNDIEFLD